MGIQIKKLSETPNNPCYQAQEVNRTPKNELLLQKSLQLFHKPISDPKKRDLTENLKKMMVIPRIILITEHSTSRRFSMKISQLHPLIEITRCQVTTPSA